VCATRDIAQYVIMRPLPAILAGLVAVDAWVYAARALLAVEAAERARLLDYLSSRRPRACPHVGAVEVYMPRGDRARTLAAFVDGERCAVHIVWSDEYVPGPRLLDEAYRALRRRMYGRTTDVETVAIDYDPASAAARLVFHTTFGEPNPYQLSVHNDAAAGIRWTGVVRVYSWTWNHLMSWRPSPWVEALGGYRVERPRLLHGSRRDAERYRP